MTKEQVEIRIEETKEIIKQKQEEKEEYLVEISKKEAEIKIKHNKVVEIDESLLTYKEELIKLNNAIEILNR